MTDKNNLKDKYLIENLTEKDVFFFKNNNIDVYSPYITSNSKYDCEEYIYTNKQELLNDLKQTFLNAEELLDACDSPSKNDIYNNENIKSAKIEDIAYFFTHNFDLDNHIDLYLDRDKFEEIKHQNERSKTKVFKLPLTAEQEAEFIKNDKKALIVTKEYSSPEVVNSIKFLYVSNKQRGDEEALMNMSYKNTLQNKDWEKRKAEAYEVSNGAEAIYLFEKIKNENIKSFNYFINSNRAMNEIPHSELVNKIDAKKIMDFTDEHLDEKKQNKSFNSLLEDDLSQSSNRREVLLSRGINKIDVKDISFDEKNKQIEALNELSLDQLEARHGKKSEELEALINSSIFKVANTFVKTYKGKITDEIQVAGAFEEFIEKKAPKIIDKQVEESNIFNGYKSKLSKYVRENKNTDSPFMKLLNRYANLPAKILEQSFKEVLKDDLKKEMLSKKDVTLQKIQKSFEDKSKKKSKGMER